MIFALLTLFTAIALATVAGWFSIIGIMAILAGSPMHALVAGVTIEFAKLVTTSWIYRNWNFASWKLKILLMFFTALIMLVTSMGVFGFLSKAHLEQGAPTADNSAKVEVLDRQINREKATIESAEKTLAQLDSTLDSYIGKDRADRSVVIRKRQEPERKQLKAEIAAAQKQIDTFGEEKFTLQSEVRKLELEVGPIRYIADLIYGTADKETETKNIERAVRIFILLLVLTLDPLAVTLLIAANNSLLRRKHEKEQKANPLPTGLNGEDGPNNPEPPNNPGPETNSSSIGELRNSPPTEVYIPTGTETPIHDTIPKSIVEEINAKEESIIGESETGTNSTQEVPEAASPHTTIEPSPSANQDTVDIDTNHPLGQEPIQVDSLSETEEEVQALVNLTKPRMPLPIIRSPNLTRVGMAPDITIKPMAPVRAGPWAHQSPILGELIGVHHPHFTPLKMNKEEELETVKPNLDVPVSNVKKNKYPKALSWLTEFTRT